MLVWHEVRKWRMEESLLRYGAARVRTIYSGDRTAPLCNQGGGGRSERENSQRHLKELRAGRERNALSMAVILDLAVKKETEGE